MECKNVTVKHIYLTEKEKDILDSAWNILDNLNDKIVDYLVLGEEEILTGKKIKNIMNTLENVIDANVIIGH